MLINIKNYKKTSLRNKFLRLKIYEIVFYGFIENIEDIHGATLYLQTKDKNVIKNLFFKLLTDNGI